MSQEFFLSDPQKAAALPLGEIGVRVERIIDAFEAAQSQIERLPWTANQLMARQYQHCLDQALSQWRQLWQQRQQQLSKDPMDASVQEQAFSCTEQLRETAAQAELHWLGLRDVLGADENLDPE